MTLETFSITELDTTEHIVLMLVIAAAAHLVVRAFRHLTHRLLSTDTIQRWAHRYSCRTAHCPRMGDAAPDVANAHIQQAYN
jgi:hypothetical protein